MEREKITWISMFARDKTIIIETVKGKKMFVNITGLENECVLYNFQSNNEPGKIRLENIVKISFWNKADEKDFVFDVLSAKYKTPTLREKIENFEKYYMEIIQTLLTNEKENSKGYTNLDNKNKMYPNIFKNLPNDEKNLLFYYFTKKQPPKITGQNRKREILLIEQANLSQKKALKNALNEKISIIEGPPGTGKTTTILNILANLMFNNQKVLVVSKNNSAIENVVEELEKMNIPKCYIRMRKY